MCLFTDVDECDVRRRPCPSDKYCINKPETFDCQRKEGYTQLKNGTCEGNGTSYVYCYVYLPFNNRY